MSNLRGLQGYESAVTLVWKPQWSDFQSIDQSEVDGVTGRLNLRKVFPEDWETMRVLQVFTTEHEVGGTQNQQISENQSVEAELGQGVGDLPPIAEEDETESLDA